MIARIFLSLAFFVCGITMHAQTLVTGVLVIGGGTGGVAAGIQSARQKVPTVIVEPCPWLGGMLTAAGVSATDGNHNLHSGLWQEFRQQLHKHYNTKNLVTGWVSNTLFEPHVGDSIFKALCAAEKKYLTVLYGWQLQKILKQKNTVTGAVFINSAGKLFTIKSSICIDATELGDAMALSNTAYDAGMEDAVYSGEAIAPGKNDIIQDLTWAAILKDYGAGANKTIPRPQGYDSAVFFRSCLSKYCNDTANVPWTPQKMLLYGKIKNNKYMLNWPAAGNDFYLNVLEASPQERMEKYQLAKNQTLQFIYYIQKELGFKNIGLADDEFPTADKLALIPYNRESRRLKGLVRFTNNELVNPYNPVKPLYRTGIAVGDYPVDHHHHKNELAPKIKFTHVKAYNIPLGSLIPLQTQGLIAAEKNISVSNIANGTTRLQPVVLLTGQAAGALAAYCVQKKIQPRNAVIREVQQLLLDAKCYLQPYADVQPDDVHWEAIQKTGTTGILQGLATSEGWANKTFFQPDSTVSYDEFTRGINNFFPSLPVFDTIITRPVLLNEAWQMLTTMQHRYWLKHKVPHKWPLVTADELKKIWEKNFPGIDFNMKKPATKRELAVLTDNLTLHPFAIPVNWQGVPAK